MQKLCFSLFVAASQIENLKIDKKIETIWKNQFRLENSRWLVEKKGKMEKAARPNKKKDSQKERPCKETTELESASFQW